MQNVLFINKPKGMTSFALCKDMRPVFGTRSIGHTGTLDPNATGVMVVLLDKATKANQFLTGVDKEYIATVELGYETDTLDIDGKITEEKEIMPFTRQELEEVLSSFLGVQKQMPPLTSAIRIKGKRLYEYQREGKEVEIPEREVEIRELELLEMKENEIVLRCAVSSGTYIRSLARDIFARTGNLSTLKDLQRTRTGSVTIDMCDPYEEVVKGNYHLHSLHDLLKARYYSLEAERPEDIRSGKPLPLSCEANRVYLYENDEPLAVYERSADDGLFRSVRGLF